MVLLVGVGPSGGDMRLAACVGLALGLVTLLPGSCLGTLVATALVTVGRLTWKDPVPLGLFWAVGGVAVLVW